MQVAQKAARFNNVVLAVRAIAKSPLEVTADLAASIDEADLAVMERTVEKLVPKMNGGGAEVASWLHPGEAPTLAPATVQRGSIRKADALPKPDWKKSGSGNATVFGAKWQGMTLRIEKVKPAQYEGFIDDVSLGGSKFKKSIRERVEQESTKRALLAA